MTIQIDAIPIEYAKLFSDKKKSFSFDEFLLKIGINKEILTLHMQQKKYQKKYAKALKDGDFIVTNTR